MAKIAFLGFPAPGHAQGVKVFAGQLQERGHDVTIYTPLDGISIFENERVEVKSFAESNLPKGSLKKMAGKTVSASGIFAFAKGIRFLKTLNRSLDQLEALKSSDVVLYDELYLSASRLIKNKKISFSQALSFSPTADGKYPPFIGNSSLLTAGFIRLIGKKGPAPDFHLRPYTNEFFRQGGGDQNAFDIGTGPWIKTGSREELSQKKDYIYVSFGTLVDEERKSKLISVIQSVCEKNKIKAIISCGNWNQSEHQPLKKNEWVEIYDRVDQIKVLKEAKLMITHGGLNSVQECIQTNTPMIVIPMKHDQILVSKQVENLALGTVIPFREMNAENLERALQSELKTDRSSAFAHQQNAILQAGGLRRAIEVVEAVEKLPGVKLPADRTFKKVKLRTAWKKFSVAIWPHHATRFCTVVFDLNKAAQRKKAAQVSWNVIFISAITEVLWACPEYNQFIIRYCHHERKNIDFLLRMNLDENDSEPSSLWGIYLRGCQGQNLNTLKNRIQEAKQRFHNPNRRYPQLQKIFMLIPAIILVFLTKAISFLVRMGFPIPLVSSLAFPSVSMSNTGSFRGSLPQPLTSSLNHAPILANWGPVEKESLQVEACFGFDHRIFDGADIARFLELLQKAFDRESV